MPVVMTRDEVRSVLSNLAGDTRLMASLMYGAGLRLIGCLRLPVQDTDFSRNEITVRNGKGARDRIAMLPESLKKRLQEHLRRVKAFHEKDSADSWSALKRLTLWTVSIHTRPPNGAGSWSSLRRTAGRIQGQANKDDTTSMKRSYSMP